MRPGRKRVVILATVVLAALVAAAVYIVPLVQERNHNIALGREWSGLLKEHATFSVRPTATPVDVTFSYAGPSDEHLGKLREMYNLETIAGRGSETDRIINLTRWVYYLTGHANDPRIPEELNAFSLIHLAKDDHMTINCYMKTIILNEMFLATGFSSRWTHLLPHSHEEDESHFVTSVYSRTLGKWILMDPDFGAYLTDDNGSLLGVAEIRNRLITGKPMVVVGVDTSQGILAQSWGSVREFVQGADYLWYLSKNIFKIRCPQVSTFNQRAMPDRVYFELLPDGYRDDLLRTSAMTTSGKVFYIDDEDLFWQKPAEESR
jgi:hypothetical protein